MQKKQLAVAILANIKNGQIKCGNLPAKKFEEKTWNTICVDKLDP